MRTPTVKWLVVGLAVLIIVALVTPLSSPPVSAISEDTLKSLAAERGIKFGSLYQYELRNSRYNEVFEREMNVMTLATFWGDGSRENRPTFDFTEMDAKVQWGRKRDMELHGHVLVWFEELPDWIHDIPSSEIEEVMNEHIDTVVGRYAGKIALWDVVNEAVDYFGALRDNHVWVEAMGDDYIRKAFVRAHEADPTAILRYNDYEMESNKDKFVGVKNLLIDLRNEGTPVDALGWQLHVTPGSFDADILRKRMNKIADLGIDNYITELDVALPKNATKKDYERQKRTYKKIVKAFLAARRHKTIVVWGLRDGGPYWLTKKHPLLFDENLEKKPAYFGVLEALQQN